MHDKTNRKKKKKIKISQDADTNLKAEIRKRSTLKPHKVVPSRVIVIYNLSSIPHFPKL